MLSLNPHLFPDGGYTFTLPDGVVLRGEGWKNLESRVRGYRALNHLPPGDPWLEITTQHCARQPSLCRDVSNNTPAAGLRGAGSQTFNQRVMAQYVHLIGLKRTKRLPRVDDGTAARRAAICSTCPQQKGLNTSCSSCMYSLQTSRKVVLDGGESRHQNLQPCNVLAEDCQTTVHVDQASTDAPGLPAHCWRRPPQ